MYNIINEISNIKVLNLKEYDNLISRYGINDVATKFGGGGHKYASGVKLKTWDDSDKLINELDNLVKNYKS